MLETTTVPDETVARSIHALSNLLAIALGRAEALLAEGGGADAATRTEGLEIIRNAVLDARDELRELRRQVVPAPAAPVRGRQRVLLIDDDPLILETMTSLLDGAGYEVETTTSGEDGVERYRRRPFDCVVTDALMLGISGLIVCRAIKDHDPRAYVVVMTGVEHDPDDLRAAGVDRVLIKPARRAQILDAVRRFGA